MRFQRCCLQNHLNLFILACLLFSSPLWAEGETVIVSGKTYQWVETSRRYVGNAVQKMTGAVDSYLSRDNTDMENESYLRLRLGYVLEEGGHGFPNNDIKLKVDLPKTKNRWSLIFETDPEDFESLEDQQLDNKDKERTLKNTDNSIGAVKFILDDWAQWKNDFDVGIKTSMPLDPFVRFNTKRRYSLSEYWGLNIRHSLYYFYQERLGEHSTAVFDRPLDASWTFFNAASLRWQEAEKTLEYSDVITFQHRYTERDIFLYRTGAFYQERPKPHLQSYFVDIVYRRRLYEQWLYGELVPGVTWSEVNQFKSLAALSFRIEVIFD